MAKKTKAPLLDLDAVVSKDKISVIASEELTKLKSSKSDNKKLPSITARVMGDQMFKNIGEGRWLDTKSFSQIEKDGLVRTFKKELTRWARHQKRDDLRVKAKIQQDRVGFYYEKKGEKSAKKKNGKKTA
jgi:hypothetical protein